MSEIEKTGSLYLGKRYDPQKRKTLDEPVLYESRDLTTHAVCVGMTGSGKTGLCVDLLEEAALEGIPAIVIDPKGDMTNLLLTFPELQPEEFRPWVNPDDARRKGLSPDEYAQEIASTWAKGLGEWGIGPERLQRLRDAAEFAIYTPGSEAGQPISILQTLKAPALSWDENEELLREKIAGTVTALLALIGIEADPVKSREHILLANIFEEAWRKGENLDITQLILRIQKPPMAKLGVFPVETFFPEKDRLELAMALNSLIATPSFENWIEGQALDVDAILHTPKGKPRVSIFYIAHLDEAERMFFMTLLLGQVQTWMRAQSGTTSLRAILYCDEVFGYLPTHPANPPSKPPFLYLLKQARAFGLGLVLTTQNPVDLDYKALSNAGTWLIGKLQTERDKLRVLEGLEGALSAAGALADRAHLDKLITSLESRAFLLHNVHAAQPLVFKSRWAMSYLRGPLTRDQIKTLVSAEAAPPARPLEETVAEAAVAPAPAEAPGLSEVPPQLPSSIQQYFLPVDISLEQAIRQVEEEKGATIVYQDKQLLYEPALLGLASMYFTHTKSGLSQEQTVGRIIHPLTEGAVDWSKGEVTVEREELSAKQAQDALFADLPPDLGDARRFKSLEKEFADYLYRNVSLTLLHNPGLKLYSTPDETAKEFQRRCRVEASERRDTEVEELKKKYEKKLDQLESKKRREERELSQDEAEYEARKREELLSAGESVLGLLAGRRSRRAISTASRKRRMTQQAKADIEESVEAMEDYEAQIQDLREELENEIAEVTERWAETIDVVEKVEVRAKKADISIEALGLAWVPRWRVTYEDKGATRQLSLSAYD
ncbi:MAG: hypothetical protein ACETWR_24315 [Anaerolineae bacterium]